MFMLSRKGSDFQASGLAWFLYLTGIILLLSGFVLWLSSGKLYNGLIALIGFLILNAAYWKGLKEEVEYDPYLEWRWGYKKRQKAKLEKERQEQKLKEGLDYYEKFVEKDQS